MTDLFAVTGEAAAMGYRVVIESSPVEAVTHPSMTRAASTTGTPVTAYNAQRADGLKLENVEFSIKTNPTSGKLDVGGITIKIVDVDNVWSRVFDLEPTAVTWLTLDCNATDTVISCLNADAFAQTGGLIWVDGEAMYYNEAEGTDFNELVRGVLSPDASSAQYHYVTDGERLRNPEITNWPVLWEGRRVVVYRYDEGDEPLGDGHAVYRGVVTSAPSFDGEVWSIGVDHMMGVLEQTFGEDLGAALAPRGVHYTSQAPFRMNVRQYTVAAGVESNNVIIGVQLVGFYETQEAFCTALNTAIAAAFAAHGGSGTLTAASEGPSGWHLVYHTDVTTAHECNVQISAAVAVGAAATPFSFLDPPLGARQGVGGLAMPVDPAGWGNPQEADSDPVGSSYSVPLTTDTTYYFYRPFTANAAGTASVPVETTLGSVPRGAWSWNDDTDGRTIYLGGGTAVSSAITQVLVKGTDLDGNDYEESYHVASVDPAARSIELVSYTPSAHGFLSDALPEIRLGLALGASSLYDSVSVADMLDYVAANQQQYQTLGILPGFRTEDYDSARWHEIFDPLPQINTRRLFVTFSPVSLLDIVIQELLAAACMLSLTNTGKLIPARLRLPAPSEFSAIASIDETTLLTDKQRTTHEVAGVGQVNQLRYKTGYVASTGNFDGPTFEPRDVSAFAASALSRPMEIAQRSQYVGSAVLDEDTVLLAVGSPIFGALSARYAIDTIDAAKSQAVEVGQPITFDNPYLLEPDGNDANSYPIGALGVVGRVGLVIGKVWGAYSPRTRFTVLNTKQRVAGYAPSAIALSQVNTSGNKWVITVDDAYFPPGADASDFYTALDQVQILKFNSTSVAAVQGTVTAVSGNVVSVTFDSTWTPSTFTWVLTIAPVTDVDFQTTQARFCQVADATNTIDVGGDHQAPARVFGS